MFEFTRNVLLSGQFKIDKGGVVLLGQPISLLPTATFAEMTKRLIEDGEATTIYRAAMYGIPPFVQALKQRHVLELQPMVKILAQISYTAGWGEMKLVEYKDKEHRYVFTTVGAPITKMLKMSKEVCHIMRGLIVGSMREIINDQTLECIETKCMARGAPLCQFIVQPKKSFDPAMLREFGWQIEGKKSAGKVAEKKKK